MTEITRVILEKELKKYKRMQARGHSNYYGAHIGLIRRFLKLLDEDYVESKDRTCPFRKISHSIYSPTLCTEEECRCWDLKRKDCGLKVVKE